MMSSDVVPSTNSVILLKNPLFAPISSGLDMALRYDIFAGSGGEGHISGVCGVRSTGLSFTGAEEQLNSPNARHRDASVRPTRPREPRFPGVKIPCSSDFIEKTYFLWQYWQMSRPADLILML